MNAIEIHNLRKSFGKNAAVDDVSFSVAEGEFFGFLGPNGAGKTTTIHCITGIASIDAGSVSIFGVDAVGEYRHARALAGLSPQEFNIDMFAAVWKALDYVGGYYAMPKKERRERIEELLDQLNLTPHRNKPFMALSGGLKRRVMLAKAMIHDPPLLILDEPTAGVDVELRHELWDYLRRLNKEGKTIFLTSHYLEEVELLSGRVVVINQGRIAADVSRQRLRDGGEKLEDVYLSITKNSIARHEK